MDAINTNRHDSSMWNLAITWVLCGVPMVLASMYGFSFEYGGGNTIGGAKEQGFRQIIHKNLSSFEYRMPECIFYVRC
jgi:hypothetical protein